MISIDEASTLLDEYARIHIATHKRLTRTISLLESAEANANISSRDIVGSVLAVDIISPINVPDFDNSAMDGYALCVDDRVAKNTDAQQQQNTWTIAVKGEASAGGEIATLQPQTCMRIFTGAPVPYGANTIVPQEDCETDEKEGTICIRTLPKLGAHIRPKQQNFSVGEVVCRKGDSITVEMMTILASLGIVAIEIFQKCTVGICITGNELQSLGTPLKQGQIYESNGVFLKHTLAQLHCDISKVICVDDDKEKTRQSLQRLAEISDVVICTGGVSVGEKDFIKDILLASKVFIRKVAIKPGKPFSCSELYGTPIFGLPGNPLSTYITFLWFVKPFIKILQGRTHTQQTLISVASPTSYPSYPRTQFIFSTLDMNTMRIEVLEDQGSSALKNLLYANGAMIIPANTHVKQGDMLQFFADYWQWEH